MSTQNQGFEKKDTSNGPLFIALMASVFLVIGTVILTRLVDRGLMAKKGTPNTAVSAPTGSEHQPPEPRLQVDAAADLQRMHAAEDLLLNQYGWTDSKAGIARIPVSRAMAILANRGLPARAGGKGAER